MNYLELSNTQVALAAALILINALISFALRLNLERILLLASLRTIGQLLLIGLVLDWVFQYDRWYVVIGLGVLMTVIAGWTAARRSEIRYPGIWLNTLVSMWASGWLITAFGLLVVMRGIDHWYQPQYAIPLLGMILGNILNGVTLGQNSFLESLRSKRDELETMLALGASRWEAARGTVETAVRTGTIPIINAMMVVGLVSLPGMMTGQLLAGTPPMQAVRYQIVIMFLIAAATSLGTVAIVLLGYTRLFSADHRFLSEELRSRLDSQAPIGRGS